MERGPSTNKSALGGRLHIGQYLRQGHKIWAWRYDLETTQLFHTKDNRVDLYEPELGEGARTRANAGEDHAPSERLAKEE